MGRPKLWVILAVLVLLATACSDEATPPTLATGTTATTAGPTTTTSSTTTSTTTTTTTTAVVTTTENPDARFAEIERLAKESLVGRFVSIFDKDPEALLDYVGSQKIYDGSLAAMEQSVFLASPTPDNVVFDLSEVLLDRPDCVVASFVLDSSALFEGAGEGAKLIGVWWPSQEDSFLLAAFWQGSTPQTVWIEECDLAVRGITP